jgi:hypothetical protein
MPLFNFRLSPLDEKTMRSGGPSWYFLTAGAYWMTVGGAELFRYTGELLEHFARQGYPHESPYETYFVYQLYRDLAAVVPEALEPVPPEVISQLDWLEAVRRRILSAGAQAVPAGVVLQLSSDDEPDSSGLARLCYDATDWWRARRLPVMHLVANPDIYFWRVGDRVHVRWRNSECRIDGIPVWTAGDGEYNLPAEEFRREYWSFYTRLAAAMAERVETLCGLTLGHGADADCDELRRSQAEFQPDDRTAFPSPSETDWNSVRVALRRLDEEIRRLGIRV